ncbi:MAG: hypothetical protein ACREL2_03630, partial [Gemmatimonadales bacterium]
ALLLQQGGPVTVIATVTPDRVTVGSDVVLTINATSPGSGSISLDLPSFGGFVVLTSGERSTVAVGLAASGGPRRVTTWEYHLRAVLPGHFALGPVRVDEGGRDATAPAVEVTVSANAAAVAAGLDPRVQSLLERAPAPPDTGVAVTILPSSERVLVGEQLDVVTAAWFPRELRMRLRHPPTLEPPEFEGVWSYPQGVPAGIAASREVGGTWYDLFILHQIVFPLTPGPLHISPATLRYGVPVAFQFFSQEDHYALESAVPRVNVLALPDSSRPPGFGGAVGSGLTLDRAIGAAPRTGDPLSITVTLQGGGNVSLWPAPFIRWPTGLPVYSDGTDDQIRTDSGRVAGEKVFRYLIVPDSSGTLALPTIAYPYYDLTSGTFQVASVPAMRLSVASAGEAPRARASPPPLLLGSGSSAAWRLVHDVPPLVWYVVMFVLPVAWLWRHRPRRRPVAPRRVIRRSQFAEATELLEEALRSVVGTDALADGGRLPARLAAAGVDASLAGEATEVWERVRALRFAPGESREAAAIADQAREVARRLAPRVRRGRSAGPLLLVAFAVALSGRAVAQAPPPPPEQLYDAGALHAAASGFHARALAVPSAPSYWYDLGAAEYRLGNDGDAMADWARALRLDPRSITLARAWLLLPSPDPVTASWLQPWILTPEEVASFALALWSVGWLGLLFASAARGRWWMLVSAGAVVAVAAWGMARHDAKPLAVVRMEGPVRVSPYGSAPPSRSLPVGTAVRPERRRGGWVLVQSATGDEGWIPADALAPVVDF